MSEPLIELQNVRKGFDGQSVLTDVSLSIERDLVTTIIGRSGIGKSVLLKLIIGLLEPDGGYILYQGRNVRQLTHPERRGFKREISYMFQHMALFDSMTVYENVALPLEEKTRMRRGEIRERVMGKLEQLDLSEVAPKYPSQISGGMRKRVALARALILQPRVVLFDEPTTGLDPIRRNEVHRMIAQYQRRFDFTAVIVSHDIPEVFSVSQKVAMLEDGRILFEGTPEAIQSSADPRVRGFLAGEDEGARSEL